MLPLPFNPFSAISSKIFGGLSLALLLALGVSHCSDKRHTRQRDEARAQIVRMELASEQARKDQIAANLATEARYRANAEKTDAEHQKELAGALRAADRYAAAHSVRQVCRSGTGQAPAPAESPTAPRDNGPGESADMVAVTREDFDTLTENTLRLKAAHDWANGLVEHGLAVKPIGERLDEIKPAFGMPR